MLSFYITSLLFYHYFRLGHISKRFSNRFNAFSAPSGLLWPIIKYRECPTCNRFSQPYLVGGSSALTLSVGRQEEHLAFKN